MILKNIFFRIIFSAYNTTGVGFNFYSIYTDSIIVALPGMNEKLNYAKFFAYLHQFIVLQLVILIVLVSESTLVVIGFNFLAIINIFRDMIRQLDNPKVTDKTNFLIEIHKFHCGILKNFKLFSDIFGYVFAVQFGTSGIFMLFIFYLIQSDDAVAFLPLYVTLFVQFGVICIFGELIFSKTENIFTELYLTKWYDYNVKEQKMLLLMMCMARRPFGLKAAGMYDINILMFFKVVKAGISFCTLLYTFT